MIWLFSLALASPPTWQGSTASFPSLASTHTTTRTPLGDLRIGIDNTESYRGGTVTLEPRQAPGFNTTLLEPCDLDADGFGEVGRLVGAREEFFETSLLDFPLITVFGGDLEFRDPQSDELVASFPLPDTVSRRSGISCVDVDGDGDQELLARTNDDIRIWNADGTVHLVAPTTDTPLAFGQLDGDAALEAVLRNGDIVDANSWMIQGQFPGGHELLDLMLADIDGDGIDEGIAKEIQRSTRRLAVYDDLLGAGGTLWRRPTVQGELLVDDFDGNGTTELVYLEQDSFTPRHGGSTYHVVDPLTGLPLHPPIPGESCSRIWAFDRDGTGARHVLCDDAVHTLFNPTSGTFERIEGQGTTETPLAGDLDGDGVAEVLWTSSAPSDRAVLRDAFGFWLDMLPLDPFLDGQPTLVDTHNNGRLEVVLPRGDELLRWSWSPTSGFTALTPIVVGYAGTPAPGALSDVEVHALQDLDGDGDLDLVYTQYPHTLEIIDIGTGTRQRLTDSVNGTPTAFDIDGDGVVEVMFSDFVTRRTKWVAPDGTVEIEQRGRASTFLAERAQPTWVACTDECRAFRYAAGGRREVGRIDAQSLPGIDANYRSGRNLSWVDGQLWYAHTDLRVYDYATDSLEIIDLQVGRMAFAEGVLWYDARGPGGMILP